MTRQGPANINYAWTELMIREFVRLGVARFFIAPGSRSSPLALAAAEHGKKTTVHIDERGLGFAALGHARACGRPSVIITTSGTAVANLHPAVCEAAQDEVPLIILSADRPPELRDIGANQTMDQVELFGSYARHFVDIPCPDPEIPPAYLFGLVRDAYNRAVSGHPGPVHLNQMLREPLAPVSAADGAAAWYRAAAAYGRKSRARAAGTGAAARPDGETLEAVAEMLAAARRGLVVAGSMDDASGPSALEIARRLKWPLLPDIRSGLRLGRTPQQVIQFADQVLLSRKFAGKRKADVILHLGGRITSKRVQQYIGECGAPVIMVNPSPARLEQGAVPRFRLRMRVPAFVSGLPSFPARAGKTWLGAWTKADAAARETWSSILEKQTELSEPAVAFVIAGTLPDDHGLVLAASMPVRDADMYGYRNKSVIQVTANRGVSGIDGTVATAAGYALGSGKPVTLLIGDLALLHDLNSLALLRSIGTPVTVVVINNNGGGIFSMLPVAGTTAYFEQVLGTPHGLSFEGAASLFGLEYAAPENMGAFEVAYRRAAASDRPHVIEVITRRDENALTHKRIQARIKRSVDRVA